MEPELSLLYNEYEILLKNNPGKEEIAAKLDEILPVLPEGSAIHFSWDDTTRLVLDCAPEELQLDLIKQLWTCYSKTFEDEHLIEEMDDKIEAIRSEILLKYYTPSDENNEFVKKLMKIMYEL